MCVTKEYLKEILNEPIKDINWFKEGVESKMKGLNVIYKQREDRYFEILIKSNSF